MLLCKEWEASLEASEEYHAPLQQVYLVIKHVKRALYLSLGIRDSLDLRFLKVRPFDPELLTHQGSSHLVSSCSGSFCLSTL